MSITKHTLDKVNCLIISALENGCKPWQKTWSCCKFNNNGADISTPVNLTSKTAYRGINRLILSLDPSGVPLFLTFKQIQQLKGSIKPGAKALPLIYFSKYTREAEQTDDAEELTPQSLAFMKYYNVFNITDTTLDYTKYISLAEHIEHSTNQVLHPVLANYLERENIPLRDHASRCFYTPSLDCIHMVNINHFTTPIEFYHTLTHEIIHSTGHASRLDRLVKFAKKKDYAFEELVADTAASYLLQHFGQATTSTLENSASYVASWLEALDKNPYFFYQAAKQAELATNYVLKEAL